MINVLSIILLPFLCALGNPPPEMEFQVKLAPFQQPESASSINITIAVPENYEINSVVSGGEATMMYVFALKNHPSKRKGILCLGNEDFLGINRKKICRLYPNSYLSLGLGNIIDHPFEKATIQKWGIPDIVDFTGEDHHSRFWREVQSGNFIMGYLGISKTDKALFDALINHFIELLVENGLKYPGQNITSINSASDDVFDSTL